MGRPSKPIEQGFREKVDERGPDECWPWLGDTKNGYGSLKVMKNKRVRKYYAHRLAYQFYYKADPGKKYVCHDCDNPICCNPAHLFLGSHLDNQADKIAKGRQSTGSGHGQALLDELKVEEIVNLLRESRLTYKEIGDMYGVSVEAISGIKNGVNWTHVTGGKVPHKTVRK